MKVGKALGHFKDLSVAKIELLQRAVKLERATALPGPFSHCL